VRPDDLDGESTRRTRAHSDTIVEELELGVLWDEYGLVGDIVVRFSFHFHFVPATCWHIIAGRDKYTASYMHVTT
jgi:hypothetical protein